jgi:hypothetical protein
VCRGRAPEGPSSDRSGGPSGDPARARAFEWSFGWAIMGAMNGAFAGDDCHDDDLCINLIAGRSGVHMLAIIEAHCRFAAGLLPRGEEGCATAFGLLAAFPGACGRNLPDVTGTTPGVFAALVRLGVLPAVPSRRVRLAGDPAARRGHTDGRTSEPAAVVAVVRAGVGPGLDAGAAATGEHAREPARRSRSRRNLQPTAGARSSGTEQFAASGRGRAGRRGHGPRGARTNSGGARGSAPACGRAGRGALSSPTRSRATAGSGARAARGRPA